MQYLTSDQVKGYAIQKKIGAGGFGEVYLAVETRPNFEREVALKVISPVYANEPRFIQRFESEARMIARLEYPYIVPLYDYWRDPNGAYLVMRWLKGGSVKELLENGPLELATAVRIMNQICSALALAHKNAVIHRDIKPGNILLDEEGNAYLSDFGIAKDFMKFDGNTQPEDIIGSPKYISPEQARSEAVTPRTDVYSLGVTLYEMLAGEHPFPNANTYDLIYKHLNEPLPQLTEVDSAVQDDVNLVIEKATAKNPANRYEDVLSFARAFHQAAQIDTLLQPDSIEQHLTVREQQILSLVVQGKTNKEIAAELYVTIATVKWHLSNAYKKLGVTRREQAIVVARNLTLIGDDATFAPEDISSYIIDFEPENPYKGLESFTYADAGNFFGRDTLVDKLLVRMQQDHPHNRFLAVLGPSGSGKSSLTMAGLIPALWEGRINGSDKWLVADMIPHEHPVDELEIALRGIAAKHADGLSEMLSHNERGLVKAAQLILPNGDNELLLIIDQFEEVFTLVASEEERVQFLNLIANAVTDSSSRVRIVITIRADYYDRPLYYPQFGDILRDRIETVLPLSAEEMQAAIVQPSRKVGVKFEDGLVATIISDINYQPGSLPLLQYALTELFDQREGRTITHEVYEKIGGAAGAIASTAEELFLSYDETGQETIRQMFLRLVTLGEGAEDTRRRTARDELLSIAEDSYLMDDIIDTFAYARMLSLDNDPTTREPTVEVAHEAILREWERLRGWLNDSRDDIKTQRQLSALSAEWEKYQQSGDYVVRGSRLEQLQVWSTETSLTLTPSEQAFLDASIAEREQRVAKEQAQAEREANLQLRARRVLQGLVAVFLLAAVVSLFFALRADAAQKEAEDERDKAELSQQEAVRERDTETSRRLAALAEDELEGANPEVGVLLALEALESYPFTTQAKAALAQAVEVYRAVRVFEGLEAIGINIESARWSPDGTKIAAGSSNGGGDHAVIIWDGSTGNELLSFSTGDESEECPNRVRDMDWSKDSTRIAVIPIWELCPIYILDVTAGEISLEVSGFESMVTSVTWSPDGTTVTAGHDDGTITLWDASSGDVIDVFPDHSARVNDVVWSPDGEFLISVSSDSTVRLRNETQSRVLHGHIGPVYAADWNADSAQFVTGGEDGLARIWDANIGEPVLVLRGNAAAINYVDWSEDGDRIATVSQGSAVTKIWHAAHGDLLFEIPGFTWSYGHFSPDNNEYITSLTSRYGQLQIWDVAPVASRLIGHNASEVQFGDWSYDGNLIATNANDGVRIWDAQTGQEITYLPLETRANQFSDWSPDSPHLVIPFTPVGDSGLVSAIVIWDVVNDTTVDIPVPEHLSPITADWSPDGKYITASLFNPDGARPVYVWDASTHDLLRTFEPDDDCMQPWAEFSPDSSKILAACFWFDDAMKPRSARIWDLETGELLLKTDGMHGSVYHATWSPDGERIALTYPGIVEVRDADTGELLQSYARHGTARVDGVAWHPDGTYIATGDNAGVVKVWHSETGEEVASYVVDAEVQNTEWSPDGTHIIIAGLGTTEAIIKRVWLSTDELKEYARECCVTRELTPEERAQFGLPPRDD